MRAPTRLALAAMGGAVMLLLLVRAGAAAEFRPLRPPPAGVELNSLRPMETGSWLS